MMSKKQNPVWRFIKSDLFKIWLVTLFLVGLIFHFSSLLVSPAPPDEITLAAGTKNGNYYRSALNYREAFAKHGITVNILETSGAIENLELVKTDKADLALVQSGLQADTVSEETPLNYKSLGSLYYEPLWVFSKESLPNLAVLKGKAIAIGTDGSGTQAVVRRVLKQNGITNTNSRLVAIGGESAATALQEDQISAAFFISGIRSKSVLTLLNDPTVQLLSINRAEAYQRIFHFVSVVDLPEGVVNLGKNIPSVSKQLISSAALLVVRKDLHPAIEDLLMTLMTDIHHEGSILSEPGEFPSEKYSDIPIPDEARRYHRDGPSFMQKHFPFWLATYIDRIKFMLLPLITLLFPLFKIMPPTYRWRIRSRIYKWYNQLGDIEEDLYESRTKKQAKEVLKRLDALSEEVKKVHVPNSYAESLYNLKVHIELIRNRAHDIL